MYVSNNVSTNLYLDTNVQFRLPWVSNKGNT